MGLRRLFSLSMVAFPVTFLFVERLTCFDFENFSLEFSFSLNLRICVQYKNRIGRTPPKLVLHTTATVLYKLPT